jgi:uncharacterized membrane protein YphA (DoxX/SURF4 family)
VTAVAALIAHETWFVPDPRGMDWAFAAQTSTLLLLAAAVLVTLAVRLANRRRSGVDVPALAAMAPYMPFAVRLHLAVSLVGLLSLGFYLSPAMDLQTDVPGIALGVVMAIVAILLATGFQTRAAAVLLIAAGPLGMLEFGVAPVLQRIDVLGLAAFVLIAGPGRWSADHELGRADEPDERTAGRAVWALRVAAGTALVVVAFFEKLADPELALAFLREQPDFNLAQVVGLGMSDLEFIRLAGAIEVLFGLLLISGALPQLVVLVAGIPFNATLWFFGNTELVGHLPVYGAMLVLLVFGSSSELRPWTYRLWPWQKARRLAAVS